VTTFMHNNTTNIKSRWTLQCNSFIYQILASAHDLIDF
jgi:hypothetical protein